MPRLGQGTAQPRHGAPCSGRRGALTRTRTRNLTLSLSLSLSLSLTLTITLTLTLTITLTLTLTLTLTPDEAGARRAFRRALAIHPDYPDALYWLGRLALQRGELAQAEALLGAALERNAVHPEAHLFALTLTLNPNPNPKP